MGGKVGVEERLVLCPQTQLFIGAEVAATISASLPSSAALPRQIGSKGSDCDVLQQRTTPRRDRI